MLIPIRRPYYTCGLQQAGYSRTGGASQLSCCSLTGKGVTSSCALLHCCKLSFSALGTLGRASNCFDADGPVPVRQLLSALQRVAPSAVSSARFGQQQQIHSIWAMRLQQGVGIHLTRPTLSSTGSRRPGISTMAAQRHIRLVAFDLDGTLWYPEMYMLDGGAPFRRDASGAVYDSAGERVKLLGDTVNIITQLSTDPAWADTEIAYVSRTEYPEWAIPCLQQFIICSPPHGHTLYDVGVHSEVYPGSKLKHFKVIHERSGIDYCDMLFFDNERWNCTEVSKLGVKCVYTPKGLTLAAWKEGLALFDPANAAAASAGKGHKSQKKVAASRAYGY